MTYLTRAVSQPTPQSEPLDNRQIRNDAGGHVYPVSDMTRLRRFLILGSEGGSYYTSERELTLENASAVRRCVEHDGPQAVAEILDISTTNRAPKEGPPIFALAIAASFGNDETRRLALENLPRVARTGSHLQLFVDTIDGMRQWSRSLRNAISHWYADKPTQELVYQVVKYRQRYGWTHRDILRMAHSTAGRRNPALAQIFDWCAHGVLPPCSPDTQLIHAYEQAKSTSPEQTSNLIRQHHMTWEMISPEMLQQPQVWQALAEEMPATALLRNLATLTRQGIIAPMNSAWAVEQIERIGTSTNAQGPHPISILCALLTYRSGRGGKGQHTWIPVAQVVDALDAAFERSFTHAPSTGKRFYLGIDVSASMADGSVAGVPGLTPRMAASAMAMGIARREPNYHMAAFTSSTGMSTNELRDSVMSPLDITAKDSLYDAMQKTHHEAFGGTDCALPMLDALRNRIPVDCFIILTDNQTWQGDIHVTQALRMYRREMDLPARLVVIAMTATEFSIADPQDAGMLDVVGFDTATPLIIADFVNQDLGAPKLIEPTPRWAQLDTQQTPEGNTPRPSLIPEPEHPDPTDHIENIPGACRLERMQYGGLQEEHCAEHNTARHLCECGWTGCVMDDQQHQNTLRQQATRTAERLQETFRVDLRDTSAERHQSMMDARNEAVSRYWHSEGVSQHLLLCDIEDAAEQSTQNQLPSTVAYLQGIYAAQQGPTPRGFDQEAYLARLQKRDDDGISLERAILKAIEDSNPPGADRTPEAP